MTDVTFMLHDRHEYTMHTMYCMHVKDMLCASMHVKYV